MNLELPFSIRITNDKPDSDRIVVDTIAERDQLVTDLRAYVGMRVYRKDLPAYEVLISLGPAVWDTIPVGAAAGPIGPTGQTGPTGPTGSHIIYGVVDPTTEGLDGDSYINTATNFLFGPKAAGTWPAGVSLVGPTGPQGLQGDQGIDGAVGPQGDPGPQGVVGPLGPTGPVGPTGPLSLFGNIDYLPFGAPAQNKLSSGVITLPSAGVNKAWVTGYIQVPNGTDIWDLTIEHADVLAEQDFTSVGFQTQGNGGGGVGLTQISVHGGREDIKQYVRVTAYGNTVVSSIGIYVRIIE